MSNNLQLFARSINAYLTEHTQIKYCNMCQPPSLCMKCMTSIGEATLVKLVIKKENKEIVKSRFYIKG